MRYPIVELRQYTLHPEQRDVLIELFDRELVESQEAVGMAVIGQFRDLDDPNRFVWLRGFADMPSRAEALTAFYGGPVWKANSARANATMVDSDDVLLLRPATSDSGFSTESGRATIGHTAAPAACLLVTLCLRDRPYDAAFAEFAERHVRPSLAATGATVLAFLETEYAENTFPALPVRTGENAFVWITRFASEAHLDEHRQALEHSDRWQSAVVPELTRSLSAPLQQLRLAPTPRSLLR